MSDKGFDGMPLLVSTKEISEIIGVTTRRINQLEKENALVKVAHGKFDLAKSVQAYLEYNRQAIERAYSVGSGGDVDINEEKALLTKANREYRELELKILRGEVHRSGDVAEVMNRMLANFKARMRTIPTKVAPSLIGEEDLAIINGVIKAEVDQALLELSEYDPSVFANAAGGGEISDDEETEEEEPEEA